MSRATPFLRRDRGRTTATLTTMCLLVVVTRPDSATPLLVGANRDERLERPATAVTVLRDATPRILGGRDEEAGGTWLAVNEHGVVAGLTNRPSPDGRDPSKRSRGELPLALAQHRDARSAVEEFVTRFRAADYNPAWLLVGDRTSLFALDMTGAGPGAGGAGPGGAGPGGAGPGGGRPVVEELGPGVHILENNPLHTGSPKQAHVRELLGDLDALEGAGLMDRLRSVLVDHTVPAAGPRAVSDDDGEEQTVDRDRPVDQPGGRPVETLAACVHTDAYGTRSSTLVSVPAAPGLLPRVLVADGHPCTSRYVDVTDLFET